MVSCFVIEFHKNIAIYKLRRDKKMNHDKQAAQQEKRTLVSIPLHGCLMVIILSAIAGIMVNECKRSKIRLENDRQKYQNDTIKSNMTSTKNTFVLNALPRSR